METFAPTNQLEAQRELTPQELINQLIDLFSQDEVDKKFAGIIDFNNQKDHDQVATQSTEIFEKIVEPFAPRAALNDKKLQQRCQETLDALVAGGAETLHIELWNLALIYAGRSIPTPDGIEFATRSRNNEYLAEVFTISTLPDGSVLSRCEYAVEGSSYSYQVDAHGEDLSVFETILHPDGTWSRKKLEGAAADTQMRAVYMNTLRAAAINLERAKQPSKQSEAHADARTKLSYKLGSRVARLVD